MNEEKKIMNRFIMARKASGLTQKQLAEKIGISQQSISEIENGETNQPRFETVIKLAKALNVSAEWLAFGTGQSPDIKKHLPSGHIPIIEWPQIINWSEIEINENTKSILKTENATDKCYALIIENDTMMSSQTSLKNFSPGEKIIINPELKPKSGNYVIAYELGAETAILRLYMTDGKKSYLKTINRDYPSTVEITDDIKILGVVIAHVDLLV